MHRESSRTPLFPIFFAVAFGCGDKAPDVGDGSGAKSADISPLSGTDADGDGWTDDGGDCDDTDPAIHPSAAEVCDEADNNCDGTVDEGVTTTFYDDADGDGFGNPLASTEACSAPTGTVTDSSDCDDMVATTYPGAPELCNTVDDDCDTTVDEDGTDGGPWTLDLDGDDYADPANISTECTAPANAAMDATDCDDTDATVYPGSTTTETPGDGIDQDCDGLDVCTDLNCDGQPDILAVGYWDDDGTYGDADTFLLFGPDYLAGGATELAGLSGWHAETEDLNQDGYVDIVVVNSYAAGTRYVDSYVYWGSASGHSDLDRTDLPTIGATTVLRHDLDGDGWTDLVFANSSTGGNQGFKLDSFVYWGSGSGYSTAARTDLPTYGAWEMTAGDLDNDGYEDLVFCNYYDDSDGGLYEPDSTIYWGDGAQFSTLDTTSLATAGCRDVETADFNGDGLLDLVFANTTDNTWAWQINSTLYENDGNRFAAPYTTGLPTSHPFDVAVADVDGDGDDDLVFASLWGSTGYEGDSYVYYNDAGSFSAGDSCALPTMGAYGLLLEDLDQDGYVDLVVPSSWDDTSANVTTSQIYWGSTSGFCDLNETTLPTLAPLWASAGDLDEDGYIDLVFPSASYETYASESYIYWGSASGYSSGSVTAFATDQGSAAAPVLVGI